MQYTAEAEIAKGNADNPDFVNQRLGIEPRSLLPQSGFQTSLAEISNVPVRILQTARRFAALPPLTAGLLPQCF